MEASHEVHLAALIQAGSNAGSSEDPRSCHFTKLSSGTHLLVQSLFRSRHKIALLLQNRQRLSRIHFLTNNSFPE